MMSILTWWVRHFDATRLGTWVFCTAWQVVLCYALRTPSLGWYLREKLDRYYVDNPLTLQDRQLVDSFLAKADN